MSRPAPDVRRVGPAAQPRSSRTARWWRWSTCRASAGPRRRQRWSTSIVDVGDGRLLDVVAGRDTTGPCAWLAARSEQWRANIAWATLDLSGPYRAVFDIMLPDAVQVADPFHVVKLA